MLRSILFMLLVASTAPAIAAPPSAPAGTEPAAAPPDAVPAVAPGDVGDVVADAADVDEPVDATAPATAAPPTPPTEPPPLDDELGKPMGTVDIMASFFRTMLMLGVVLALVWLTLSKGMGKIVERAQAGKRVKVLERIALDARRSLFLVEVDGKQFVLGGGDIVRLHEVGADARPFTSVLTSASAQPPLSTPSPPTTSRTTTETA